MSFFLQAEDNGRKKNKRRKNIKDQNQRVYLQLVFLSHITYLAVMISHHLRQEVISYL